MIRTVQFITGMALLTLLEVARLYFIMPFPGSQRSDTVDVAYFLNENIFYFRTIGWLIILFPTIHFFWMGKGTVKFLTALSLLAYFFVFYLFNNKFQADKIFHQLLRPSFAGAPSNMISNDDLVLGIVHNNHARAYPIEVIGYHHQVRDTIGSETILVTYSTVSRTGRIFSPVVDGRPQAFRLVGMDHFNAMFEDEATRSWWRQVNGEAIVGSQKGKRLREIPFSQMTLGSWLELHPHSKILQPDSLFSQNYARLNGFNEGRLESQWVKRDTTSWQEKSWVVGVALNGKTRAYDWKYLKQHKAINDSLAGVPVLVALQDDGFSFHVWKRDSLTFQRDTIRNLLIDSNTGSRWDMRGNAIDGVLQGRNLSSVQSYQQFWHSWKTFNRKTSQFPPKMN